MKQLYLKSFVFLLSIILLMLVMSVANAQSKSHPSRRYAVSLKDDKGNRYTCYLFADDEKSKKMTLGSNYDDGDTASTGHFHIGLDKKGWAAPKVQDVSLFDDATNGVGEFNFKRKMVYVLSGPGHAQPDLLVVEQYTTSTHNTKRFFFVQDQKLVPVLCQLTGQSPSVSNYIPGREIKAAGPFRFKTISAVSASDGKDASQIGMYNETWRFEPSARLLVQEKRTKVRS